MDSWTATVQADQDAIRQLEQSGKPQETKLQELKPLNTRLQRDVQRLEQAKIRLAECQKRASTGASPPMLKNPQPTASSPHQVSLSNSTGAEWKIDGLGILTLGRPNPRSQTIAGVLLVQTDRLEGIPQNKKLTMEGPLQGNGSGFRIRGYTLTKGNYLDLTKEVVAYEYALTIEAQFDDPNTQSRFNGTASLVKSERYRRDKGKTLQSFAISATHAVTRENPPSNCKLVNITVVQNATQNHVIGDKNWAAVKKSTDDVIVQATTNPDTRNCWSKINWKADSGQPSSDKANQRRLSRSVSKEYRVEAELGGSSDSLQVWVVWAEVTILVKGKTPKNAVQYEDSYDGTEILGGRTFINDEGFTEGRGKVVPVALITPAGVRDVVPVGWAFRRDEISKLWKNGLPVADSRFFTKTPLDDTSAPMFQKLQPDATDKIYDRDAPNIWSRTGDKREEYVNFREWIEWNGTPCSEQATWHWRARWIRTHTPQVTMMDVGTGNIPLPAKPYFRPRKQQKRKKP
ncbi:MAG TPA: hypothetical protein VHA33_04830 [Candidatus Angelobacter sp.]|nr:hypothetical protein [Candidatus Angelobacter sp.]